MQNADYRKKPQGADGVSGDVAAILNKTQNQGEHPTVKVNGKTFEIRKFKNRKTLSLLPQVGDLLAVPFMYGIKESGGDLADPDALILGLPDMISLLVSRLMDMEVVGFVEDLLSQTYVMGMDTPVDLDEDFTNPEDIVPVLTEVLKVHFMGFMKLGSGLGIMNQMVTATEIDKSLKS